MIGIHKFLRGKRWLLLLFILIVSWEFGITVGADSQKGDITTRILRSKVTDSTEDSPTEDGHVTDRLSNQDNPAVRSDVQPIFSTSTTSTSSPSLRGSQQQCLTVSGADLSKVPSVTLLRISSQTLLESGSSTPLTFNVDSTIFRISIEVNGSDALDATIWDPAGTMMNKRLRREARSQPRDENKGIVTSSPLPLLSKQITNIFIGQLKNRSTFWHQGQLHHQRQQHTTQDKQQTVSQLENLWTGRHGIKLLTDLEFPDSEHFEDKHQHKGHTQQVCTSRQLQNEDLQYQQHEYNRLQHPYSDQLQENKKQTDNLFTQQLTTKQQHRQLDVHFQKQLYSYEDQNSSEHQLQHQLHRHQQQHPTKQHQLVAIKRKVEGNQFLVPHASYKSIERRLPRSRHKSSVSHSGNGHTFWQGAHPPPHQPSARIVTTFRQKYYKLILGELLLIKKSQIDKRSRGRTHFQVFENHKKRGWIPPRVQHNNKNRIKVESRNVQRNIKNNNNKNNNNKNNNTNNNRRRRSISIISLDESEGAAVWEVEPPETGLWKITIDGPEPVQIVVTALSILDFHFEFLDVRTMTGITSQPVAYDTTLARLTLTSLGCIGNVTMLYLYSPRGETIAVVEYDNIGVNQGQMAADGKTANLVWFQMPDVPFFMSVAGYDVMGKKFQRLSSSLVVPRMFALSSFNFRTDPLVPDVDYTFGARLRNKGRPDKFKIIGQWDNVNYFTVKIVPDVLQGAQDGIYHVAVVVRIQPSIYFITKGVLTITAIRMSDNLTETLTEEVTAEPESFQQDYESPTCTTLSTTGGCMLNVACDNQKWSESVAVTDNLTGVRSAIFLQPPPGAYNKVEFSYTMTSRTAHAEYRFTCCNMEATLLAYDYANNPAYCKLSALILNVSTTSSVHTDMNSNNMPSDTLLLLQTATSAYSNEFIDNSRTAVGLVSSVSNILLSTGNKITFTSSTFTEHSKTTTVSGTNNWMPGNKTAIGQHTAEAANSSTLRLAAIVCGSLAGVAGLAIAGVCVTYRYAKTRRQGHTRRQSNGSDVTMGSSSESRSDGGSEPGSLRMAALERRAGNILSEHNFRDSDRGINGSTRDSNRQVSVPDSGQVVVGISKNVDIERRQFTDGGNRKYDSRRPQKADDITFSCVVTKVFDKSDNLPKEFPVEDAQEHPIKVSYSPLLRAGGKTYASMLQVQKQVEEMDRQQACLSSAVSQRGSTQSSDASLIERLNVRKGNAPNTTGPVDNRADALKRGGHHYATPPGSPQLNTIYNNSQDTNEGSSTRQSTLDGRRVVAVFGRCQCEGYGFGKDTAQQTAESTTGNGSSRDTYRDGIDPADAVTQGQIHVHYSQRNHLSFAGRTRNYSGSLQNKTVSDAEIHSLDMAEATKKVHARDMPNVYDSGTYRPVIGSQGYIQTLGHIQKGEGGILSRGLTSERGSRLGQRRRRIMLHPESLAREKIRSTVATAAEVREHIFQKQQQQPGLDFPQFMSLKPSSALQSTTKQLKGLASIHGSNNLDIISDINLAGCSANFRGNISNADDLADEQENHAKLPYTPRNSPIYPRSGSPDVRFAQQSGESDVISEASQMALRHGIEHIRQKLLNFQRRIDQEIEEEVRKSGPSPCASGNHSNTEDD